MSSEDVGIEKNSPESVNSLNVTNNEFRYNDNENGVKEGNNDHPNTINPDNDKKYEFYSWIIIVSLIFVFIGSLFLIIYFSMIGWDFNALRPPMNILVPIAGIITGLFLFILIVKEPLALLFYPKVVFGVLGFVLKCVLYLLVEIGDIYD